MATETILTNPRPTHYAKDGYGECHPYYLTDTGQVKRWDMRGDFVNSNGVTEEAIQKMRRVPENLQVIKIQFDSMSAVYDLREYYQ